MVGQEFDPGPVAEPFRSLATTFPASDYAQADFRTEWGPIFHRGRLDGSARVLAIGQDPGQHENILRRILVGEAGRRAQGFLAKLGITRSYVLVNALLYSVYGDQGAKYVKKPEIASYRNAWIEAILSSGKVQAVVTFGGMAKTAWETFASAKGLPPNVKVANLTHPTYPESSGGTKVQQAANTKKMLAQWNTVGLDALFGAVTPDSPAPALVHYGDAFLDAEKPPIPSFDLPPGIPAWMYAGDGWAQRVGTTAAAKRANITITVPKGVITP
jgi:uracil-DNA glycosylase